MSHFKLIYFPIRGRAECIRLIFAAANVAYEDFYIEGANWPSFKSTTPFGQLPILEIDGKRIAQTNAIGRYLAREFGLAGKTNLENAIIDMLIDGLQDAKNAAKTMNMAKFAGDIEKANAAWNVYREEVVFPTLERFTNFLKEAGSSGWFVGDSMTWADIAISEFVEKQSTNEAGILSDFPELKAHQQRVYQNAGIAKRVATRPDWKM